MEALPQCMDQQGSIVLVCGTSVRSAWQIGLCKSFVDLLYVLDDLHDTLYLQSDPLEGILGRFGLCQPVK